MIDSLFDGHFPRLWGRRLPRSKYQRPSVYATGKREKLWKAEWREYYIGANGKECSRHKSKTWARSRFTKAEAQAEIDALLRDHHQAGPKRDGSMTLEAFWEEVYHPVRSRQWEPNTKRAVLSIWRRHIKPRFGLMKLNEITKADLELHLGKLADAGNGESLVDGVLVRLRSMLEEAADNDFIPKNPARKIVAPPCKEPGETRALTVQEVQALWDAVSGMDYLIWRVLILTGVRISELLALERGDILPDGLLIDHSAYKGQQGPTKNKKERTPPLPASLRDELLEWLETHTNALIFPNRFGRMHHRGGDAIQALLKRGRISSGIKDLTFRMCRTTFTTLFEGDIRDAQEILGHHSPQFTLKVYRKPILERQQKAVEDLDSRLKVVSIKRRA